MNTEHAQYIARCEDAFNSFVAATPSFVNSEANCRNLVASLDRLGLTYDRASHLEIAFRQIKPKTPAQAPAAPAPESLEAAIEKEANRILASGEIEDALLNLSAKQFEQKSYNLAFARALELREERRAKDIQLARGDVIAAEQRAAQQGTSVASEIAASEKRMVAAQNPVPYSPTAARRSGIVSTHDMGTSSTRRKKTPEQVLASDRADQKSLETGNKRNALLKQRKTK